MADKDVNITILWLLRMGISVLRKAKDCPEKKEM